VKRLIAAALIAGLACPVAHADTDLTVTPHVKRDDYRRAAFGVGWPKDANGCSVRDDILARDLTVTEKKGCQVVAGTLNDPYTGQVIRFHRGAKTGAAVQIDHVVPLSYAWDMGAWAWTDAQRATFYADPNELLAVSGKANDDKGDKPPGEWMPPDRAMWCPYDRMFVAVLRTYHLSIDPASNVEDKACR
jgi:hypothetical protein